MRTATELRLRAALDQCIDVSALLPSKLGAMPLGDIARIALPGEWHDVNVGDLFDLRGEERGHLVFTGDCASLLRLGAGLDEGVITVEGNVGDYVALGMRGGHIDILGNAADYAGAEMHAGHLRIRGDCGDFAAAALPGSMQGMRGGVLYVQGNAGARAADRMRRGLLLVEGDCGDFLGSRMLAGTAMVRGRIGASPGFGLRRGTLMLWRPPQEMPANFNDCGRHRLGYLTLMARNLPAGCESFSLPQGEVHRWCGDLAEGGYGEILQA